MNSDRDDIAITYPVERPLIERAIELLTKQRRTIGQFHKFLVRSSIAFVSAMAIAIIVRLIERALGWTALDLVAAFLLLPLIFAGAALALAFLAGIPQLATQWWFSHRLRKAGFSDTMRSPQSTWLRESLHVLGQILGAFGVLVLFSVTMLIDLLWLESPAIGAGDLIVFSVMGLLFTVPSFLGRRRRALDFLRKSEGLGERLAQALGEQRSDEHVQIRAQDLNLMASIEQAEIERERAAAISNARRRRRRDHLALLHTRDAAMTIRSLDPDTRMLVEEQAANLTQATRRAEAQLDERSGLWQIQVPGTNLRLDYSVDERKHQVKLISVAGQR